MCPKFLLMSIILLLHIGLDECVKSSRKPRGKNVPSIGTRWRLDRNANNRPAVDHNQHNVAAKKQQQPEMATAADKEGRLVVDPEKVPKPGEAGVGNGTDPAKVPKPEWSHGTDPAKVPKPEWSHGTDPAKVPKTGGNHGTDPAKVPKPEWSHGTDPAKVPKTGGNHGTDPAKVPKPEWSHGTDPAKVPKTEWSHGTEPSKVPKPEWSHGTEPSKVPKTEESHDTDPAKVPKLVKAEGTDGQPHKVGDGKVEKDDGGHQGKDGKNEAKERHNGMKGEDANEGAEDGHANGADAPPLSMREKLMKKFAPARKVAGGVRRKEKSRPQQKKGGGGDDKEKKEKNKKEEMPKKNAVPPAAAEKADAKASGQTESAPFLGPKLERKPKRPELDGMLLDRAAILAQQRARGRRIESLDSVLDRKKKEEKIEKQKEMEESNWKMAHRYSQGYTKPDTFGLEKAESENLNKIATDDGTVPTNNNGQLGNGIGQQPNIGANAVNEGGHNGIGAINERTNNGIGHNIGANAGSQVYNDIEHAGAVNEGAKNGIPHNIGADAVNIGSNGIGPNGAGAEAHNDGAHHSGAVTEGKNGIQHNSHGTVDSAGIPFNHAEMPSSVNGEHSTMENGGDAVPENEEGMAEENVAGSKWNEEKAPANGHIAAEGMRHQEDVPLAQLLERHNPTAQMPEGHNPTAQMPEGQNPALTPEGHSPTAQLLEGHNPTAQLPEGHNPTAQLPEGHNPTAQLPEGHNPTAQMPEGHNPTAQMPEGHNPTAQMPEGHNPTAQMPEGHNPTAQMPEGHNPTAQMDSHGHNTAAQLPEGHIPTAQLPEGHNPIQQAFSNIVVDGEMPEWDTAQLPQEKLDWEKGVDANANLKRHDMEGERTKGVQIGEDRNAIVPYGMSPPKEVWHKTGPQSNDAIRLDEANNAIVPVGMPPGQNNAIVTPEMPSGQNNAIVQAKMPPGQNNAIVLPEMPLGQNNAIVPPEMPSGQNNAIVQAEMPPGQHNAIGMPSENVWHKEMALGNGGTNGHPNGAIVAHHGPSSMVKSGDHHQGPTAQNGGQNGIALAAKTAPATGHGRMEKQPAEFATQQCHVEKPKLVCTLDRHEFTFFIKLHDKAHLLELAKKCTHITLDVGNFLVDKGIKVENMIKRVEDKGKKEAHGENGRKMDEEERNWKNLKEFKQLIGDKVKLLAVWQFAKDSHKEAFKNQMKRGGQIVAKKGGTNAADRLALIKGIIDMAYHDLFDGFLLDFTGDFKFFNNHYAHLLRDFRLELVTKKMPKGRDRPIFAVRLDSDASMELDKTGQEFGENLKYADLVLTEEGKKDKKKAPLAFDPFAAIHAGKFAFPNLLVHKMKPDRGLIKMIGDGCKRIVLSIGMLHKELAAKAASNGGRSAAASAQATAFAHAAMAHAALARFSPTGGKIGTKGEKIRRRRKRAEVRDEKGRLIVPFAPHGTKMDGHGQIVPSHGVNIPIGHSHVPRSMKEPMALPLPVPEPNSSTPKIHPLPLQIHPNPHLPQIHPDHPQIHPQIHPPPHHRLQFPIIIGKDQMAKAAEGNGTANNPLENNKMEGQNKGGGAKEEMPSHNEIDVKLVKDAKKHFAGIAVPFYKMSPNGASGTLNSAVIEKAAKMLRGKK